MTPDQILAFVAALVATEPDVSTFPLLRNGGADSRYAVSIVPCAKPVSPLEIEGKTLICGTVNVPEDHATPEGRRMDLKFAVYKSRSLVPAADAVVHLHGGPGGGIVDAVSLTSMFFEKLRARRDIVAFDQRGVDASGADTRCVATVAGNVARMVDAASGTTLPPEAFDALAKACLTELKANGTDISKINTEQNALDVQAVMRALGYPVYNVYGISYGTKLGLEVMRAAPEGVRSVVLDSVAPPHIPTYDTQVTPHAEAIGSIFTLCAEDAACNAAYPDLKSRFWPALMKLEETPLVGASGPVAAGAVFALIDGRNNWQGRRGITAYVPLMIHEFELGQTTTWDALQSGSLPPKLTADTVLAGATGLSGDERALAQVALQLSKQSQEMNAAVTVALQQLESDRAASAGGAAIADLFDTELANAAKALPDREDRMAFAGDYLKLRGQPPAPGPLLALVAQHFTGEQEARLAALIRLMGPADLADTFGRIATDNRKLEQVLMGEFELMMFFCQEDMDINSMEGVRKWNAQSGFPRMLTDEFEKLMQGYYTSCRQFPPQPRPGFHDPVVSPIPALVLSGMMDTQTATSWGPDTAQHLGSARSVVFPETGHGALAFSDCAQDLGVAFIENPEAKLDLSCAAALKPVFALPPPAE
jgi:pimeloyl-ACP methyl ester carboxylesterase